MSNSPFFSVVIPTYNRPQLAVRAIESVLQQEYQDFEILLIDDGSDDDYSKVVEKYKLDKRFIYHKQNNAHLSAARNKGIQLAKGKWICFLDDDDYYLNNHLNVLKVCIDHNSQKIGMYRTFTIFENEKSERVYQELTQKDRKDVEYSLTYVITVNNVCLHKSILEEYKFDESLRIAEDYNMWVRILCKYTLFEAQEHTTVYFQSSQTMSSFNLSSTIKYLTSYLKTFSIEQVENGVSFKTRKRIISKYVEWYFNLLIQEKEKLNYFILKKVICSYPSIMMIKLLSKFYLYRLRK